MIGIIDYKRGNIRSVYKAIDYLGYKVKIISSPKELSLVSKIILPGVGAFGDCMGQLNTIGFTDAIIEKINNNISFLGICLGLQFLFENSEESKGVTGLNIFKGSVKKFSGDFKIPHMGWNRVFIKKDCPLFNGISDESYFYFVHSYKVHPFDTEIVLGETGYFGNFVSAVSKNNIYAVQFHPEKSQDIGLQLLKNWVTLC